MNKEFQVHILNDKGLEKAQKIAALFNDFLDNLVLECGVKDGREAAIVRTKLEEACFFAKKAIANDPGNQKTEEVKKAKAA